MLSADAQQSRKQARAERLAARERFKRARIAEKRFARQMRAVAAQIDVIVKAFAPKGKIQNAAKLTETLRRYGETLRPWAQSVSQSMLEDVARRDAQAWAELGKKLGRALRKEVQTAKTGELMRRLMNEQVDLITSLPRKAAERVHKYSIEALSGGQRAEEAAKEIMKTGRVTKSRAMLIARTETSRTATSMVQARSEHVGSEGYIWRTSEDVDVRHAHKKLEGKFIKWNDPPVAGSNGMKYHAGAGPNCRCWPEPVVPDPVS